VLIYFFGYQIRCEENNLSCNVAYDTRRIVFTSNEYESISSNQVTLQLNGFSLSEFEKIGLTDRLHLISKSCDNKLIEKLYFKISSNEIIFYTQPGCWTYNFFAGYEFINFNQSDKVLEIKYIFPDNLNYIKNHRPIYKKYLLMFYGLLNINIWNIKYELLTLKNLIHKKSDNYYQESVIFKNTFLVILFKYYNIITPLLFLAYLILIIYLIKIQKINNLTLIQYSIFIGIEEYVFASLTYYVTSKYFKYSFNKIYLYIYISAFLSLFFNVFTFLFLILIFNVLFIRFKK
jgi:hypothetical protein